MTRRAVRLLISGAVQGVGYRDWASRTARELGLSGWVRNRIDGSVEVWAEGPSEALDQLRERAARGPRYAEVSEVRAEPVVPEGAVGFVRKPTTE